MICWLIIILLLTGTGIYAGFLTWIEQGLKRLREKDEIPEKDLPAVSVIVPARNEDNNIEETLESLLRQDYPRNKYEVIAVNDRSYDRTQGIMRQFAKSHPNFKIVNIDRVSPDLAPKKNAIEWGIAASTGEIIITTDADCVHSPKWVRSLMKYYGADVGLVAGLTIFEPDNETIFHRLHSLDYFSHSLVGAGAIGMGAAMNCTGANLSYRYSAYMEIVGFGDKARMVSGDDEFFLQKLVQTKKLRAIFALGDDSVVKSLPPETLREILHQRLRWGSKGLYYPMKIKRCAIGIFSYFLLLTIAPVCIMTNILPLMIFVISFIIKVWSDFRVIKQGCKIFRLKFPLLYFTLLSLIHPPLIILNAIAGHLFPFRWKGELFRSRINDKG